MRKKNQAMLERKALRVEQKQGRCVYLMSLTGAELLQQEILPAGLVRACRLEIGKVNTWHQLGLGGVARLNGGKEGGVHE